MSFDIQTPATPSLADVAEDIAILRRQMASVLNVPLDSFQRDCFIWNRGDVCGFSNPLSNMDFDVSQNLFYTF